MDVPNDPQFQSSWRTIPTGAVSEYVAHEEVILLDGFLAETGSNFYAHIAPCESCDGRGREGIQTEGCEAVTVFAGGRGE